MITSGGPRLPHRRLSNFIRRLGARFFAIDRHPIGYHPERHYLRGKPSGLLPNKPDTTSTGGPPADRSRPT